MKEVALLGNPNHVFADVLSVLLKHDIAVNAYISNPEHLMLDNTLLSVSLLDVSDEDRLTEQLEGYHDAILVFNDDQTVAEDNDFALRYFLPMVNAARRAGVARLIVVGSPEATAYFMGDLRRQDGIDWVFISTEGDFADRTVAEVEKPHYHREEYPA